MREGGHSDGEPAPRPFRENPGLKVVAHALKVDLDGTEVLDEVGPGEGGAAGVGAFLSRVGVVPVADAGGRVVRSTAGVAFPVRLSAGVVVPVGAGK